MRYITICCIFTILVTGCETTKYPFSNLMASGTISGKSMSFQNLSTSERNAIYKARDIKIDEIKQYTTDKYSELTSKIDYIENVGDKYARGKLWLGASGIISGIGASILVVASPANAAVVAGLAAYTTGVTGFQTNMENVGFSKEHSALLANQMREKAESIRNNMNWQELREAMVKTDNEWLTALGKIEQAIFLLEGVPALTKSPTIGQDGN